MARDGYKFNVNKLKIMMQPLPVKGSSISLDFQCLFSKKVFAHATVLLLETLPAVSWRSVCAALVLWNWVMRSIFIYTTAFLVM